MASDFDSDFDDAELIRDLAHKRLAQMKSQHHFTGQLYGNLQFAQHEREILAMNVFYTSDTETKDNQVIIIHFANDEFERCKRMTNALAEVAKRRPTWRCIDLRAQEAPFLVTKLGVKVLPCVVVIRGGIIMDKMIGFEGIGLDPDVWTVVDLERRLAQHLRYQ